MAEEMTAAEQAKRQVKGSTGEGLSPIGRDRTIARAMVWAQIAQAEAIEKLAGAITKMDESIKGELAFMNVKVEEISDALRQG